MSNPRLHDFESMMKAAEAESALMFEATDETKPVEGAKIAESAPAVQPDAASLPSIPKVLPEAGSLPSNPSVDDATVEVKAALNNGNIASVLNRISADPTELSRAMEETAGQLSPEMIEEAKRLAMGGQGEQILREMQRRGIDPNALRAQILEQQKSLRGLSVKNESTKRVVLITSNRQLKMRNIPLTSITAAAERIIGSDKAVELSCSRLANGPLKGKTVKVWCDPERKGKKNQRLTKILGFPIVGEGLFIVNDEDLDEASFLAAEKEIIA